MLKSWEKAEEKARKALERERLKQEKKNKRVGKNWMKKIVPNHELREIPESPYLPLESAKRGGVLDMGNEAVARKKGKKES